jgi:ankyrin repeat protein
VVRALLAKGADVHVKTQYGKTALMFAENKNSTAQALGLDANDAGHAESVRLLKEAGAD